MELYHFTVFAKEDFLFQTDRADAARTSVPKYERTQSGPLPPGAGSGTSGKTSFYWHDLGAKVKCESVCTLDESKPCPRCVRLDRFCVPHVGCWAGAHMRVHTRA